MTRPTSIAIIGLGSRGLSVLERISTLADRSGPAAGLFQVELIDPRADGAGVHATDQPDYLLLNTTAAQVSMFPDADTVGEEVAAPGPSLYDWVTARDLRVADDGFSIGEHGRPIRPTDFLPRRILGEYLGWFLAELRRRAPAHITLRTHQSEAVDLTDADGRRLAISLANGDRIIADYAFLTTGYTTNLSGPQPARPTGPHRLISSPYPLPKQLDAVRPGESIAIGGFGLSAMDLLSSLTVGRGGKFHHAGDQCHYLPSGREPTLLFYSRSGLPCRARPQVTRFDKDYQPRVFTTAAIDALRLARGGALDFDRDLLPLAVIEMRIGYRRCEAALVSAAAEATLDRRLDQARGPAGITAFLDELDQQYGRFDAAALLDGSAGMLCADHTAYQKWLSEVVKADLAEGLLGFTGSPVKAALDVLRVLRDNMRYAIDFGGLTEPSLDDFHRRIVPMLNRAVVGPQFERHSELLALLAAGIAHAPFGPAPAVSWQESTGRWLISSTRLDTPHAQEVDWLCVANLPLPALHRSASPLLEALHRRGWARPHRPDNPQLPGIDLDPQLHPIRADATAEPRLWALGPLCEGATFYNNLVPSPRTFSRPIYDAHRSVQAMFARVAADGGQRSFDPQEPA